MKKYNSYEQIRNSIATSIGEIVEPNDKTISLFETIKLIEEELKPLLKVNSYHETFTKLLNLNLKRGIENNDDRQEVKELKHFEFDDVIVHTRSFKYNTVDLDIYLHRNIPFRKPHYYATTIRIDENNEIAYTVIRPFNTTNRANIEKCISYSNGIFKDTNHFVNSYQKFIYKVDNFLNYNTDLFTIRSIIGPNGIKTVISPNKNNVNETAYYNSRADLQPLQEYVDSISDLILWSIPIEINSLPSVLQKKLYANRLNDEKVLKKAKNK